MTGLKKNLRSLPHDERKALINTNDSTLSLSQQSELLGLSRSGIYYKPYINPQDILLMNEIDQIYTDCPFYGKRRIRAALERRGYCIGVKRVCGLMKKMGI